MGQLVATAMIIVGTNHDGNCENERALQSCGVKVRPPTAGYYIFPDFRCVKQCLKSKYNITTGRAFVEKLFDDCRVVLMSGDAFLRPDDEFTTRLCFVDFNGAAALAASLELGIDGPLGDDFVEKYCPEMAHATQVLCQWVRDHS